MKKIGIFVILFVILTILFLVWSKSLKTNVNNGVMTGHILEGERERGMECVCVCVCNREIEWKKKGAREREARLVIKIKLIYPFFSP